jgi:hypothetical protein
MVSGTEVIILIGVIVLAVLFCIMTIIRYTREDRERDKMLREFNYCDIDFTHLNKIQDGFNNIQRERGSTMIIVDVDREGCRIWHNGLGAYIRGSIAECCEELIHRTCFHQDGHLQQIHQIGMDKTGVSMAVVDYLENKGIEVLPIKFEHINNFLPRLW